MSLPGEMLKRIQLESRGRKPDEVTDLNLDNCRSTGELEGLTDEFSNLQKLSLINSGITSLKGFPNLPKLQKLELSDNRIAGTLGCLNGCISLTHLNLSGNKIKTIDALEPLADLPQLAFLDLFNCEVTKTAQYRDSIYNLIPNLKYLDGFDRDECEAIDSEDDEASADEENGERNENHNHVLNDEDEDDDDEDDDVEDADEDSSDLPVNLEGQENGENADCEEEEDDEEEDSDEGSEDEEEYGLAYIGGDDIQDDDENDDDYEEEQDEEDEEIIENEEAGDSGARGVKRKHEEEEENE